MTSCGVVPNDTGISLTVTTGWALVAISDARSDLAGATVLPGLQVLSFADSFSS